jgi:hypothetical protein
VKQMFLQMRDHAEGLDLSTWQRADGLRLRRGRASLV